MKTLLLIAFALISSTMLYAVPTSPNEDTDTIYFGKPDSDTIWYRNIEGDFEPSNIRNLKFTSDGKQIIIAKDAQYPRLLDAKSGKTLKEFNFMKFRTGIYVNPLDVSKTNPYFVAATDSETVVVGNYEESKKISEYNLEFTKLEIPRIMSVAYSNSSKMIAVAGYIADHKQSDNSNNFIIIIDTELGKIIKKIIKKYSYKVKFSNDDNYIFVSTYGFKQGGPNPPSPILVYSTKTWELIKTLDGHTRPIKDFDISPDGKLLVSCDDISDIRVWDLESLSLKKQIGSDNIDNYSCRFVSNTNFVVGLIGFVNADIERKLSFWNAQNYKKIKEVIAYQPNIIDVNNDKIIVGGGNRLFLFKNDTTIASVPLENTDVILNITNVEGRIVKSIPQQQVINNEIVLNVNDLPVGVYFLAISSGNYSKTYKLVRGN